MDARSCPHVVKHMSSCYYTHVSSCRNWDHDQDSSDTADTGDEDVVGGLGKYSHGQVCLSHQHWVDQVISAGSFGVHCTEAAEAYHKTCMRLSSQRVRHFRANLTQKSMLDYLRRYTLFEALLKMETPTPVLNTDGRRQDITVLLPLRCDAGFVMMGHDLQTVRRQQQFIHPEVRLARVEILDLLCERLHLSKTRQTYSCMNGLNWNFGQKLVLPGSTYWATDTQYLCPTSETKFVLLHVSLFIFACVLMSCFMCPYMLKHVSLCIFACVLICIIMCP